MKKKNLEITIPEPCHEQWQNMQVVRGGRHCTSCAKDVIDFTLLTDQQLIGFVKKQSGNTCCGRFYADQLNRPLQPNAKSPVAGSLAQKMAAGLLLLHIATSSTTAQAQKKIVKTGHTSLSYKRPGTLTIHGNVVDAMTRQPVAGITILCNNNAKVVSDAYGCFVFHLKPEFSSVDSFTLSVPQMSVGQSLESNYYFPPVIVKAGALAPVVVYRYIQEQLPAAQIVKPTVSGERIIVMGGMPGPGYYAAAPAPKRSLWHRVTRFLSPHRNAQ